MTELSHLLTEVESLEPVLAAAELGGRAALEFYGSPVPVECKADNSPLTLADKASHLAILGALGELKSQIPVLSEESAPKEVADRLSWDTFWLVDPLDGTKEFVKQSGEFTVNIALIRGDEPILGVVYVPVKDVFYYASKKSGAFVRRDGRTETIEVKKTDLSRPVIVSSRDHAGPQVEAFLARMEGAEVTSMGSSLKFCLVAEGKADFYPRLVPTMEWDTGAAQCIVEQAGGSVTDLDGRRLLYNKSSLRNPSLLTFADASIDWKGLLDG